MTTPHLTEEQVQRYALNDECDPVVMKHLHACKQCTESVETYRLLFEGLQQQARPAFDFDLAELVTAQLPAPVTELQREGKNELLNFLIVTTGAALVFAWYFFRKYFAVLFESIAPIIAYLAVSVFVTLAGLLIIDMYKNYRKKIHILDVYKG
jgi:hypothetical protein